MYSGKNKGSLATTPSGKISYSQTSETLSGTASTISLLQENNNVNKKITQSKQFVRWFGDWQNKPKTASKVVDVNGEPLVVYHQTGNDFTVFDTKHTGAGEFDSKMPTGIFMKPTSDNIGLRGNKQMALYANIRNPLTVNNRAELVRFYEKNIDGCKEAREDIRYAIDDTKQEEVDFRKALTREEWTNFYSSLNKYNQRDNLRIGDNSILIPDDNNAYNYKLVCYRTDKNNIRVKNVYLIENYDYNIHSNEINVLQILSDYEGEEYSEKQTRAILQNYTGMYGTLFKRYNSVSRKFVKLTRESVSDRRNIKETADGAGTYGNSEREVSGGLSEDKISDIRYANDDTVYEEKYKNLENLDDEEIKVYNKRGWAYGLFNREDMKLLNEKFSELDKRINSRTDNVLADGTRIVEINNKVVLIGGTYKEPEIYSVFEINARHEFDTESIKDDIKYGQIRYGRSRYSFEEFGKYEETCEGKDKVRFYSQTDYLYIRGRTEKGLRAVSKGDFSRYGYLEESNNGRRSGENAQGEVSSVLLDEDTSDVRFAIDDTLNDWLDDLPEGIDYEKVVEKNPVVAVAKIYNSASKTAESGLRQSQNVRLEEKDYLRIAGKIMDKYGIKGKYNPNYKQELAEQLTGFIEHIGEKGSNFTDVFEELVNDCKGGI